LLIFPDWEAVAFRVVIQYQQLHSTMSQNERQEKKTHEAKKNLKAEIEKRNSKKHANNR